jgi:hypothetical protein
MTDKISDEKIEETPINYGPLIFKELQTMNRMLGAINQNITKLLTPMIHDLEVAKNHLGKLKKMSASELTINDQRSSPSVPQPQSPIRGPE